VSSVLPKPSPVRLSVFQSPANLRGLADEFAVRLAADITSGKLAPGMRLPTEQQMIAAHGVSRTVVREAVAALRAEGLVVTRQGAGAFVGDTARRPFRIGPSELGSLHEVIQVMELRTGIEIEAAGLAAARRSRADIARITEAFAGIEQVLLRDESGVAEDFAFHVAIAQATGNPKFTSFLDYLGRFIIPRQTVTLASGAAERREYSKVFQREHRAILTAIRAGNSAGARTAMRRHLENSRKRYSQFAAKLERA
jgi:DNA-binding FadR family transcriptional regulator